MSQKKYQVFISSTYADLKEERNAITRALYEMGCIPVGMEAFPASDEEQFEFIKRIIDETDYYILILGGRYGSIAPDGKGYTEKEYAYAREKGLPVLAFVHSDPNSLDKERTDLNDSQRAEKFFRFRNDVTANRMVKMWTEPMELPSFAVLALNRAMTSQPQTGWVRGTTVDIEAALSRIVELQSQLQDAQRIIGEFENQNHTPQNIAGLEHVLPVTVETFYRNHQSSVISGGDMTAKISLETLFGRLAPNMIEPLNQAQASNMMALTATDGQRSSNHVEYKFELERETLNTIRIQFEALKLISVGRLKTQGGSLANFWQLTERGTVEMQRLRVIKLE
ncbi:hypothetical protein A9Q94_06100 [Rhodobacterales bacterium 56_14_T64]|nr:hypothetical protein A9Q94_06100 [Rhodobacterales bacterium 56_14_T64]